MESSTEETPTQQVEVTQETPEQVKSARELMMYERLDLLAGKAYQGYIQ